MQIEFKMKIDNDGSNRHTISPLLFKLKSFNSFLIIHGNNRRVELSLLNNFSIEFLSYYDLKTDLRPRSDFFTENPKKSKDFFVCYNTIMKILNITNNKLGKLEEIKLNDDSRFQINFPHSGQFNINKIKFIDKLKIFLCANHGLLICKYDDIKGFEIIKILELNSVWEIKVYNYGDQNYYFIGFSDGIIMIDKYFNQICDYKTDKVYHIEFFDITQNEEEEIIIGTRSGKIEILKYHNEKKAIELLYSNVVIPPNKRGHKNALNSFSIFRLEENKTSFLILGSHYPKFLIFFWDIQNKELVEIPTNLDLDPQDQIYNLKCFKQEGQKHDENLYFSFSSFRIDFGIIEIKKSDFKNEYDQCLKQLNYEIFQEYDFFLSHSSKDQRTVKKIFDYLKSFFKIFYDKECIDNRNNKGKEISKALSSCKGLILILSSNSKKSGFVDDELFGKYFKNRNSIIIVKIEKKVELPTIFESRIPIDFTKGDFNDNLKKLKKQCNKMLEKMDK